MSTVFLNKNHFPFNLIHPQKAPIISTTMTHFKNIAQNKKAYYNYTFLSKYEAGIVLKGDEVKSLRQNTVTLRDTYCRILNDELWLIGCYIPPYKQGGQFKTELPSQSRKLLIHKKELKLLTKKIQTQPLNLIPLKLYFKDHLVKLEIGLGKSKKLYDKRQSIKERTLKRDLDRARKNH